MRVALAIVLTVLVFWFVDQEFNDARLTMSLSQMLSEMRHGFGLG
jgi:hypothetical protein